MTAMRLVVFYGPVAHSDKITVENESIFLVITMGNPKIHTEIF